MLRISMIFWLVLTAFPKVGTAQTVADVVWVQIEARPTLEAALERVEAFSQRLPDVNGFALQGGWYAIALGPYTPADAEIVIESYRNQRLIPNDSYIAFSQTYGRQYWPPGADLLGAGSVSAPAAPSTPQVTPSPSGTASATPGQAAQPQVSPPGDDDTETTAQARRSEAALTAPEKRELQAALQWAGVYSAAIDGAFGRGTRNAMAAWQRNNGLEATGILTTRQRAYLLGQYNAVFDGLGMQIVRDTDAGIAMELPTSLVSFSRYEAPFAHYDATGDSPARVLLISQRGSNDTLKSLYDVMQTLTIVPLDGPRRLQRNGFSIEGRNDRIVSLTEVTQEGEDIKGFTLIWPAGDEERRVRVLEKMRASFERLPGTLPPSAGVTADQQVDLVAGLEVRRPIISRSGFFVDASGAVVTTSDAVQSCSRITLDDQYDARLTGVDAARGIAVLRPNTALAPPAIARFSAMPPRLQSEVALAGYSFEGQLGAPSVTFGTLSDLRGLGGESDVSRLALDALPGDAGGPILDTDGNVFGMLLPPPGGNRQLPPEVQFALSSDAISAVLQGTGLSATRGDAGSALHPVEIADRGVGMTVLVSCWE